MGLIKNICLRIALNKEQRVVVWNALAYSDHTYRRRGNVDRAVVTTAVMSQVEKAFGVTGKKFSNEEVAAMLDEFSRRVKVDRKIELEDAYQRGRHDAIAEMLDNIKHGRSLVIGEIVEVAEEPEKEQNKETSSEEGTSAPTEGETPVADSTTVTAEQPTE